MYVRFMSGERLRAAVAGVRAAVEELAACELELLTHTELVEALDELHTLGCQLPSVNQRLLAASTPTTDPNDS